MLKKHLRTIASEMVFKDSEQWMMTAYLEMMKTKGWETHKAILVAILQAMGNDFFDPKFTNKSAEEKDLIQRVYFELSDIIKFLLNPVEEAKEQIKIQRHNQRMAQSMKKGEK